MTDRFNFVIVRLVRGVSDAEEGFQKTLPFLERRALEEAVGETGIIQSPRRAVATDARQQFGLLRGKAPILGENSADRLLAYLLLASSLTHVVQEESDEQIVLLFEKLLARTQEEKGSSWARAAIESSLMQARLQGEVQGPHTRPSVAECPIEVRFQLLED